MTGCFQCDNGTLVCRCGLITQRTKIGSDVENALGEVLAHVRGETALQKAAPKDIMMTSVKVNKQ